MINRRINTVAGCDNPNCYNRNHLSSMYCEKCIKHEMDAMNYNELVDLYIEGKEWIDQLKPVNDELSEKIINDFRTGWFALLNIAILAKIKDEGK
jgi:hypothetical protein